MNIPLSYVVIASVLILAIVLFSKRKKKQKKQVKIQPEVLSVVPKGPTEVMERTSETLVPKLSSFEAMATSQPQGEGTRSSVYPPRNNIAGQYSNPYLKEAKHPILEYQYSHNKGVWPANIGDPIRIQNLGGGPMGLYGEPSPFTESLLFSRGSVPIDAVPKGRDEDLMAGPGNRYENYSSMGSPRDLVPVPAGAFKAGVGFLPGGAPFRPAAFVGSIDTRLPRSEVNTPWEKIGIMVSSAASIGKESILNLYRRAIAPLQGLWEYQVQDKNGFLIKLREKELENGDIVPHITGKDGPWKVHDYNQNKYIWM